jgi:hypothetical protein
MIDVVLMALVLGVIVIAVIIDVAAVIGWVRRRRL